jgi:hypothetical protein
MLINHFNNLSLLDWLIDITNVVESGVKHHNPNPADYSQSCIQWSPLGKNKNNRIRQVIAYLR